MERVNRASRHGMSTSARVVQRPRISREQAVGVGNEQPSVKQSGKSAVGGAVKR